MRTTRQKFNLILTLALWLVAQTAWATDETKTFSNSNITAGSTNQLNYDGNLFISAIGESMAGKSNINPYGISLYGPYQQEGTLRLYPRISGKVKSIVFSSAYTYTEGGYMKIGKGTTWTNSISEEGSYGELSFTNADGIQLENEEDYLEIKLYHPIYNGSFFSKGSITITYKPTASTLTHTHSFTLSMNDEGNTLTATCAHNDGKTCDLASSNYQATLTLSPSVDTYYRPNSTYSATLNLGPFNALTGLNATATDITYVNNFTGDNLGSAAPTTAGNYTASVTVTVTIGGTDYTLSTDFKVNMENAIYSNIRQISVSKTSARNDEEITITFTPRLHELVNTLTVTGTNTNMSIGNGVTKVDEYTYTFMMPYDEVTIGATFKSSDTSLYKYAITTDFTGSGEVDYNAEEYLGAGDAITMTFMPYLQGNLEAGSVVFEGLTVTGATTNMSVGNGITDNGDNTYTFSMPDEDVTLTATAWLSADAILTGTINEPIYVKQGNGIQIGYENKRTYVSDGALPLVIPDGNTLRLVGGTDIYLNTADKNAIVCEGDATIELVANSAYHRVGVRDDSSRNSGKAIIKVSPAGKTLTIRVADESTESVNFSVEGKGNVKGRSCDVIGCDEGGSCGSIVVESGEVESWLWSNSNGKAIRTTDGTITFGYKFPDDCITLYGDHDVNGCIEGTVKVAEGKQYHSDSNLNLKYSGTLNLQGKNYFGAVADKYTVTFDENGGSDVDNQTVAHGMKATEPAATTREGFSFKEWKNGENTYDFNTVVTSDLTLVAAWTQPITSESIMVTIPAVEWTGSEIAFDASTVKVWDGTTLLTATTDYTVTAPTGTLQDTGNYPVTITGAGKYAGEVVTMFTIKGKPVVIQDKEGHNVQSVDNAYTITTDQRGGATLTLVTPEPTIPETPPTIVPVDIPTPVEVDHVDLDRIFEAGKACTLYLPFSIAANKVTGGKFHTFTNVDETKDPWEVTYTEVTGDIAAGTPYIFLPDGSNGGKIVVNNGTNKVSVCTAGTHTTGNGQWEFIGTYERIKWTHNTSDFEYTAAREAEIGSIYGFAAMAVSGAAVGEFVKVTDKRVDQPDARLPEAYAIGCPLEDARR